MLPREAVLWTISEVDVFLGSLGFIRPGRESSMMRSSKRLVRAVRGGYKPLEFRCAPSEPRRYKSQAQTCQTLQSSFLEPL
ncbi:unnamed protein product [Cladocopium goreaui]|uniref:SET domain-containing protein n=1 Tax=Cladocopium goreaui TaxID=2562237 RepID=A0A9P1DEQ5_9DINO|nr:unnamed protein product [Cladocopium goreaui]CAI4009159.1 unnamed protein product [Cladocopium goreaui]